MPRLIADIGATHARFWRVSDNFEVAARWDTSTQRASSVTGLLDDAVDHLGGEFTQALFAVAGPLAVDQSISVTNADLVFQPSQCADHLSCPVSLVNDFHAVARGLPDFEWLHQIGGAEPRAAMPKAVLGPGSGLGMATLVPSAVHDGRSVWLVLEGEGGHADMSPTSHLETELWSILSQETGQVSWESVLSGAGIVNLYRATSIMWGAQPEDRSPKDICESGVSMSEPICHQTMELFAGLLGCCAGNLALTSGAQGGVYIAGGIAPKIADFLSASPLRRRFEEKGRMSGYMKAIPIYVVQDESPGLIGALACARDVAESV